MKALGEIEVLPESIFDGSFGYEPVRPPATPADGGPKPKMTPGRHQRGTGSTRGRLEFTPAIGFPAGPHGRAGAKKKGKPRGRRRAAKIDRSTPAWPITHASQATCGSSCSRSSCGRGSHSDNRHRDGDVAVIEIDRHERRNALDAAHCHALRDAVQTEGARAIVITGAGSSFCSGADLGAAYDAAFRDALYAMLAVITDVRVPVLAVVNGPAIGAGAQLALARRPACRTPGSHVLLYRNRGAPYRGEPVDHPAARGTGRHRHRPGHADRR